MHSSLDGSEEIETICIVDVLRRAGAHVTLASIEANRLEILMSRSVKLVADVLLADVPESDCFDLIAIPGTLPRFRILPTFSYLF